MRRPRAPSLKAAYGPCELANMMGIHRTTVWRWMKAGKLDSIPWGKSRKVTLVDFFARYPQLWESIAERARIKAAIE